MLHFFTGLFQDHVTNEPIDNEKAHSVNRNN